MAVLKEATAVCSGTVLRISGKSSRAATVLVEPLTGSVDSHKPRSLRGASHSMCLVSIPLWSHLPDFGCVRGTAVLSSLLGGPHQDLGIGDLSFSSECFCLGDLVLS